MGTISSSIGLISGFDTAAIIEQLLAIEARPRDQVLQRITNLRSQQTALLDVNARLQNLKTSSAAFRNDDIFQSTLGTSSDEETLGVRTDADAVPGSYQFIVKQLVTSSQQLSGGFASRDATPLGLDQVSFEYGNGRLSSEVALEELNGGDGVDRGRIVITDRSGEEASVDLTDVTSVAEVVDRINATVGISVTASVDGDRLVLEDTSGGTDNLIVLDGEGDTTATDLGIATIPAGIASSTLNGDDTIYRIGASTSLGSLNDGRGVLIRDNVPDFTITNKAGDVFNIDLGRINEDIDADTLLADLNNGAGVTIDSDSDTEDITFVARDGTEIGVDLSGVTTVGGLLGRINAASSVIDVAVSATGDSFTVTDSSGGTGALQVLGGDGGTDVAEALGLLNADGVVANDFTGDVVPSTIDQGRATTIQDVIDRINNAVDANGDDNLTITASIAADGRSLRIDDNSSGGGATIVVSGGDATNPSAAEDLGISTGEAGIPGTVVAGGRLIGGLDTILIDTLAGGQGIAIAGQLDVSLRNGSSGVLSLDAFTGDTVSELLTLLNDELSAVDVNAEFTLNAAGNGIQLNDNTGGTGNLTVTQSALSDALGITTDPNGVAADRVVGSNLQAAYISNATSLDSLNGGRGVANGGFTITDGLGNSATVSIGSDASSLYDVIREINSRGLALQARVNDNGDGLIIEQDDAALGGETPFQAISIEDGGSTTAADLGIAGTSEDVVGGFIDGSFEQTVDLDASDTLDEVVAKINAAGIDVAANVINTGSGSEPYRLNLSSLISGKAGDLVIDTGGVDLGLEATSRGQDAKLFFGNSAENGLLVTSSSNEVDGVIDGVTLDLLKVSEDPVDVTISRDTTGITEAVGGWVTAFNDVIGRVGQYDFFDVETEERGVLLGNSTLAQIRSSLYRTLNSNALNVDGSFQRFSQVGINVGEGGLVEFDEERFETAYAADPQAVEQLFAAYEVRTSDAEEVVEGVTIENSELTFTSLGVASLFDNLLDDLTNSIDGVVTRAGDAFGDQIGLLETRVEDLNGRLDDKALQLQREYANLELLLADLQDQQSALSGLRPL